MTVRAITRPGIAGWSAAVALAVATSAVTGELPARAVTTPSISYTLSADAAGPSAAVTVSGRTSTSAKGAAVSLDYTPTPSDAGHGAIAYSAPLGTVTAAGSFSGTFRPPAGGMSYRVTVNRTSSTAAVSSAAFTLRGLVGTSPSRPASGQAFTLSATSLDASTTTLVQALRSGSWTTLATVTSSASRLVTASLTLPAGASSLRLAHPAYSFGQFWSPGWLGGSFSVTTAAAVTAGVPKVVGDTKYGARLSVSPGTWSPASATLSYQWLRSGVAISGATGSSYPLGLADLGAVIAVRVTGSASGLVSAQATSAATAAIRTSGFSAAPTPTVSGTAKVGSALTAVPGAWSPAPTTLSYQWLRGGAAISGATSAVYRPVAADVGALLRVRVTAARAGYTTASTTSALITVTR